MANYSRQMLSRHKTTATYEGQEEGRESMLKVFPPRPNKMWETFHIVEYRAEINAVASMAWKRHAIKQMHTQVEYESYEKPGQYGDAQQTIQRFTDLEGAHAATVAKLSKGDKVRLEWDHNYVTRSEDSGGESKYPERVITMIEPVA